MRFSSFNSFDEIRIQLLAHTVTRALYKIHIMTIYKWWPITNHSNSVLSAKHWSVWDFLLFFFAAALILPISAAASFSFPWGEVYWTWSLLWLFFPGTWKKSNDFKRILRICNPEHVNETTEEMMNLWRLASSMAFFLTGSAFIFSLYLLDFSFLVCLSKKIIYNS